jgi:hypothetical protein
MFQSNCRAALTAMTVALLCIHPQNSRAQTEGGSELATVKQQASTHFQRAIDAVEVQAYEQAIVEFEAAYALFPEPEVLYNIAQAHLSLRKPVPAARTLERYLKLSSSTISAERKARVLSQLRALDTVVSRLRVTVQPHSAKTYVSGEPIAASGEVLILSPGKHHIRAERAGFLPSETTIELEAGNSTVVSLELQLASKNKAEPGAIGSAVAPASAPVRADPSLDDASSNNHRMLAYALGGAGIVFGGVAIGAYAWNEERDQELKSKREALRRYDGMVVTSDVAARQAEVVALSRSVSDFQVVWLSSGVAALGLLGTAGYLLLVSPSTDHSEADNGFVITPTGGGFWSTF